MEFIAVYSLRMQKCRSTDYVTLKLIYALCRAARSYFRQDVGLFNTKTYMAELSEMTVFNADNCANAFCPAIWEFNGIFRDEYYTNPAICHMLVTKGADFLCANFSMNCLPIVKRKRSAIKITEVCVTVLNCCVSGIMGISLVSPNLKNDA